MIPPLHGKKKAVGLILGMHDDKPMSKMAEGGEVEANPLHVIGRELIEAVKAEDVEAVAAALRAAWSSMESEEYEEPKEG